MKEAKELSCDEYISKLEAQVSELKSIRNAYKQSKTTVPIYEPAILKTLSQIEISINGIRHTYLPLTIPDFFQIPKVPPKWSSLNQKEALAFSNVSITNESKQKELLQNYRRPGLRKSEIQKTAKALNFQQNKLKEEMQTQQFNIIYESLVNKLRVQIEPSKSQSNKLTQMIESFIEANEMDKPFDIESTNLLLLSLFSDEGPLTNGLMKIKSVSKEITTIAASVEKVTSGVTSDEIIDLLKPYIADLHTEQLKQPIKKYCSEIQKSLAEAIDILGDDASMADFGDDVVTNVFVTSGLKKSLNFEGVDNLVATFEEVGQKAIEFAKDKSSAAQMIAVAIISENLIDIPLNFMYAISWSSNLILESFTTKTLFLQAFDYIVNLIPDFG
ncbi:hypothetical protein GPJ56_006675 [Histomonas meleagridis]|uniref:uncharacterized protein n=1 Tax=Histomonas meleagridis TaxID=135588 RepID=UPI00355A8BE5|nr:hypothetical protein GPJ56_006675 [Histomonas meleagridis]KAH0805982.1 hypothetical protein GO595_001230 [Histomonas meleagridis]